MTSKQVICLLRINLLLALGYFLGGYLGTLISIPPSHASPIWPAAGIAFAGFVTYGRRVIPGIWLGALVTQIFAFLDTTSQAGLFYSLLIGGVASTAATGQAALGAWLIKRYVGDNNPLLDDASILRFMTLGGPVSCVISALAGVTTLYLKGVITLENVPSGWLTWWIGDTMGVLIFTPMLLCFIGVSRKLWRMRINSVALPLAILSLLVLVLLDIGKQHEQARINSLFEEQSNLLHNALQNKFTQQVEISQNLKALFDNSITVTPTEFKNFSGVVLKNNPGIRALEWIPRITADNHVFYQQLLGAAFTIRVPDGQQGMKPSPQQSDYFPIAYAEPYQGNERALGLDVTTKPNSYQAIQKARDSDITTMSGMIRLVQDSAHQSSVVIYSPVYHLQSSLPALAHNSQQFLGVVANVIQIHTLVNTVKSQFEQLQLRVKIVDIDDELFNETIHASGLTLDFPKLEKTLTLPIADRSWTVTYTATPQFYNEQISWNIWWLILGGFMSTGLSGVGLLMLTGRTLQTEHLVKTRTQELENEIVERKAAELKTHRLSQLYALLSQCNQAIVRCATKNELFLQICSDSVRIGGIKMVCIALIEPKTQRVRPIASFGEGSEYLQNLEISIDPDNPLSGGPGGTSIRENRPVWCQDFCNDPMTAPWHVLGARFGWRSLASLPIHTNGVVIGVFILYADEIDAFDVAVRDLLVEIASDIDFALNNFERETQRKQAEQGLQESEHRLMLSIKGSSDAPWDWDLDSNQIYYSPQWWRMLGYEADELSSNAKLWENLVHPDDIVAIQQDLQKAMQSGKDTHAIEFRLRHKESHYVPILERCFITRNKQGKIIRVSGTNMDLTDRRRAQALEEIRSFMLECLTNSRPLLEILELVALKLENLMPGTLCSILLLDDDGQHLQLAAAPSLPECYVHAIGKHNGDGLGCCGNTAFTGKCTLTREMASDPIESAFKAATKDAGLVAYWCEPIHGLNHKILGTFAIYQRPLNLPDDHTLKLIKTAAHYVSIAIEHKRAEAQLMLAAKVFEQSNEGFMITDANRNIIKVNNAFTVITGYSESDVLGRNVNILFSDQHEQDFYRNLWETIDVKDYWQGEIWNRHKNGQIYPELLNISVMRDNAGNISQYVGVFTDITQLKASETQLEFLAYHDSLTALPNRLMLFLRLAHAIETAKREGKQLALLMLDLDRFKDVNDSFGHLAGDQLLQLVATRLTTRLRDIDTVSRLGGDEFTVLLENISHPEDVARIAQEIIADFSHPWTIPNCGEVLIGVSIGISLYPHYGDTPELLLQQADTALYKAKESGRNRFAYFSNEFTLAARERIEIEARLRRAIAQNELRVYYQPQIDIISGEMFGAEALVRWQDPIEGLIQPNRFIPIAEQTGLITALGTWVLRETCRQGRQWLDQGLKPLTLAVNVSPSQLRQGDINALVADILLETRFPAEYLELELTESGLMEHQSDVIEILTKLRVQGVRLAIDDFGTGYSSLAYLKRFPLDVLKIDKSFIDDIPHHKDDMEIAATIIAMGHTLGFKVLAEGVETQEQLDFLQAQGCDFYQGYLKSRPLPAEVFIELLCDQQRGE